MYHESNHAVWSMKRRFAILSMAACVALSGVVAVSGCGVREGMEKVEDAKQAKKQVEKQRDELEKNCGRDKRTWKRASRANCKAAIRAFRHARAFGFRSSAFQHFGFLLCGRLAVRRTGRVECVRLFWQEYGRVWRVQLLACSDRSGLV